MSQKASKTPAPDDANSKPRQRPRSGLVAWGADLKAGKSSGRPIGPTHQERVEYEARDRAFFLDELRVHSEEYDRLTMAQKSAMRERWAEKHPEKLQQGGEPTTSPTAEKKKKVWHDTSRAFGDYVYELHKQKKIPGAKTKNQALKIMCEQFELEDGKALNAAAIRSSLWNRDNADKRK